MKTLGIVPCLIVFSFFLVSCQLFKDDKIDEEDVKLVMESFIDAYNFEDFEEMVVYYPTMKFSIPLSNDGSSATLEDLTIKIESDSTAKVYFSLPEVTGKSKFIFYLEKKNGKTYITSSRGFFFEAVNRGALFNACVDAGWCNLNTNDSILAESYTLFEIVLNTCVDSKLNSIISSGTTCFQFETKSEVYKGEIFFYLRIYGTLENNCGLNIPSTMFDVYLDLYNNGIKVKSVRVSDFDWSYISIGSNPIEVEENLGHAKVGWDEYPLENYTSYTFRVTPTNLTDSDEELLELLLSNLNECADRLY